MNKDLKREGEAPVDFRVALAIAVTLIFWASAFAGIRVGLDGLVQSIKNAPIESTLAIVYMGIFPEALAYASWAYVLSRIPASLAGSYLYLSPVLAIFIAWIWLDEVPAFLSLVGGFLALMGVVIVNVDLNN